MTDKELRNWIKEINEKLNNHLIHMNENISVIKNDIVWLKENHAKYDERLWWILGTVILGVLIPVTFKLF